MTSMRPLGKCQGQEEVGGTHVEELMRGVGPRSLGASGQQGEDSPSLSLMPRAPSSPVCVTESPLPKETGRRWPWRT